MLWFKKKKKGLPATGPIFKNQLTRTKVFFFVKGKDPMFLFKELKADSSLMRRVSLICNLSFTLSYAKMEGETK